MRTKVLCLNLALLLQFSVGYPFNGAAIAQNGSPQGVAPSEASRFSSIIAELFKTLPKAGTYAFDVVSSGESAIPASMLQQISSELQSEFLVASDFESKVIDRAQLGQSFRDAVEFNGAKFEDLLKGATFDAAVIFTLRAVADGFQISAQVIGARADNSGQVIASTSVHSIVADWEKEAGIQIIDGANMQAILAELASLAKGDQIVAEAKSFAEHYHNAKLYHKQSLFDDAIASYVEALTLEPQLVDLLLDTIDLAQARYGAKGAVKFLDVKLMKALTPDMQSIARLRLSVGDPSLNREKLGIDPIDHGPLAAAWLWGVGQSQIEVIERSPQTDYVALYNVLNAARTIMRSYENGDFQSHFLDPLRASSFARTSDAQAIEQRHSRVEYVIDTRKYIPGLSQMTYEYDDKSADNKRWFTINPNVTERAADYLREDLGYGVSEYMTALAPCQKLDVIVAADTPPERDPSILFHGKPSQKDINGVTYDSALKLPWNRSNDRIIYSDWCFNGEGAGADMTLAAEMIITDDVDASKPIVVNFAIRHEYIEQSHIDITKDGTYIYDLGLPIFRTAGEGIASYPLVKSRWLYAPGYIQGSLNLPVIASVTFTDIVGEVKTISNIHYSYADQSQSEIIDQQWDTYLSSYTRAKSSFEDGSGIDLWFNTVGEGWSGAEGQPASLIETSKPVESKRLIPFSNGGGCFPYGEMYVWNVEEFVNLRAEASIQAHIVGRGDKWEKIQSVDDLTWFGGHHQDQEICKMICQAPVERRDLSTLNKCVNSNIIWKKVVTESGSQGFMSAKYIGLER